MTIKSANVTLVTLKMKETREFYENNFKAYPIFDCGWYIVLRLANGENAPEICLMEPQKGAPEFQGGATINLNVEDADKWHDQIIKNGIIPVIPLEDHPWGDRGFGIIDPAGATVYCYHPIEPSDEFNKYIIPAP